MYYTFLRWAAAREEASGSYLVIQGWESTSPNGRRFSGSRRRSWWWKVRESSVGVLPLCR